MACFPKIDQPCPLGIDAQKRINGYCGNCSKSVHALDAMSDAQRMDFLSNASGPVCVSYRVRRSAAIGLGAVLVLSMAAPGRAQDVSADVSARPAHEAAAVELKSAQVPVPVKDEPEVLLMGGVNDPASAAFIDVEDDGAPELPMVRELPADPQ